MHSELFYNLICMQQWLDTSCLILSAYVKWFVCTQSEISPLSESVFSCCFFLAKTLLPLPTLYLSFSHFLPSPVCTLSKQNNKEKKNILMCNIVISICEEWLFHRGLDQKLRLPRKKSYLVWWREGKNNQETNIFIYYQMEKAAMPQYQHWTAMHSDT